MNLSIDFLTKSVRGILNHPGKLNAITGVSTDSRRIQAGDVFFALRGENFDGHRFAAQAVVEGASAVVIAKDAEIIFETEDTAVIQVDDTQIALQDLAACYRQLFRIPMVAVTGSVGKTTTKDLLALALSSRYNTLKTPGNFNNEIGLPLTLLSLKPDHQAAVIEMAMRAPGEIHRLSEIVQPDYAIISNAEPVHIETMGSIENIARAKCEVLAFIDEDHFALINGDNQSLLQAAEAYQCKKYRFGWADHCEIRILSIKGKGQGIEVELQVFDKRQQFYLNVPANQLASNLASAVGMAYLLGVSLEEIKEALLHYQPSGNRLNLVTLPQGGVLMNDTYNANPVSMIAALEALKNISQGRRTVAVLGDMFELGSYLQEGHMRVGRAVADLKIDTLVAIGESAQYIVEGALQKGMQETFVHYFTRRDECLDWIRRNVEKADCVLFKASRGMYLETLAESWIKD